LSEEKVENTAEPAAAESGDAVVAGEGEQRQPVSPEEQFILDETGDEVLRLKLDNFEGPFEVLLYLIKSQEIDIFDIPIVKVTEQYLRFLELMDEQNLDVVGEFLVMAALLIEIKSKMLLPIEADEEEEEELEEEDPRLELVEKLLEFRKFSDLARLLGDRMEQQGDRFARMVKPPIEEDPDEEEYLEVSQYDLIRAIRGLLRYLMEKPVHAVMGEGASVDEKIGMISDWLAERESVTWEDLFRVCRSRIEVICCLLAILELCRMRRVRAHQHRTFGDIRLFRREDATPEPLPESVDRQYEAEAAETTAVEEADGDVAEAVRPADAGDPEAAAGTQA
jgi:segregation and condensation protein A